MRPNHLREILKQGKPAFGTMIQEFKSSAVAYIFANAGFDFVFIDMEHGPFSIESAAELIKAVRMQGMTCLVRVPDGQYHLISRVLDAGAEGIMVPRIETRHEAEYIVSCVKYPPLGKRGLSVPKGHNDYQRADAFEFTRQANQENQVILQIERPEAVNSIDEILSVPGVDVALIGPNDLALSLGVPNDHHNPIITAAVEKVIASARAHKVVSGAHTSQDALLEWARLGMQVLVYSNDLDFLARASSQELASLRKAILD
jgi:2-keto-3-deoxy-L-rhamnonate aldolase RhmA